MFLLLFLPKKMFSFFLNQVKTLLVLCYWLFYTVEIEINLWFSVF